MKRFRFGRGRVLLLAAFVALCWSLYRPAASMAHSSMSCQHTGTKTTCYGDSAGGTGNTGTSNTFIGYQCGQSNSSGYFNTFYGYRSGFFNQQGAQNTFFGVQSGISNTTGRDNTFMGFRSGMENLQGNYNTYVGNLSGEKNTTGSLNTFVGNKAGHAYTSGDSNTFVGAGAGALGVGSYQTLVGSGYGGEKSTGIGIGAFAHAHSVVIGKMSGYFMKSNENVVIGNQSGRELRESTTIVGHHSSYHVRNNRQSVFFGNHIANSTAGYFPTRSYSGSWGNVLVGNSSGVSLVKANGNTFLGAGSGGSIGFTTHRFNVPNSHSNVCAGYQACKSNSSNGVVVGAGSGSNAQEKQRNTHIGYKNGLMGAGSLSVYIGANAGPATSGASTSNELYIDNQQSDTPLIKGNFSTRTVSVNGTLYLSSCMVCSSDQRFKTDIQPLVRSLQKLMTLRPVRFHWKHKHSPKGPQIGLIAQQVATSFPSLVRTNKQGYQAVVYANLSAVTVQALKEQHKQLQRQSGYRLDIRAMRLRQQEQIAAQYATQKRREKALKAQGLSLAKLHGQIKQKARTQEAFDTALKLLERRVVDALQRRGDTP